MAKKQKILHSRYEGETQDGKKRLIEVYQDGGRLYAENGAVGITLHPGRGDIEDKIRRECGLLNVRLIDAPQSPVN
jgi:hypothetical protein